MSNLLLFDRNEFENVKMVYEILSQLEITTFPRPFRSIHSENEVKKLTADDPVKGKATFLF